MESLIEKSFYLIVFLAEFAIILLIFDYIMSIICTMLGLSWKKVLMWAAAIFGILWLRDFIKRRKERAKEELVEIIDDDSDNEEESIKESK